MLLELATLGFGALRLAQIANAGQPRGDAVERGRDRDDLDGDDLATLVREVGNVGSYAGAVDLRARVLALPDRDEIDDALPDQRGFRVPERALDPAGIMNPGVLLGEFSIERER